MSKQQLVEDNMNLVYYLINKYYPTYLHDDDIIQEGMVGLCKAANSYDSSKSKFSTYASCCILNQIRFYFRENAKHLEVLSYDRGYKDEDCEEITFLDTIIGEDDVDIGCMNFMMFYEKLSASEQQLIDLLIDHSEVEISKILGVSQPHVSRRKTALRNKWRKFNGND